MENNDLKYLALDRFCTNSPAAVLNIEEKNTWLVDLKTGDAQTTMRIFKILQMDMSPKV